MGILREQRVSLVVLVGPIVIVAMASIAAPASEAQEKRWITTSADLFWETPWRQALLSDVNPATTVLALRRADVYSLRTVAGTTVRDSLTYNKTVPFTLSKTDAITVSGKSHVAPGANQTRLFYINVLFGPSQVGPTRLLQIPLGYTASE